MNRIVAPDLVVCDPDGGPAGGLRGHNVNGVPKFGTEFRHTGAYKLHDLVLYIAAFIHCPHNGQSNILRSYSGPGLAVQINGDGLRALEIIGPAQQLFCQFAAAFAYAHAAQRTVAGVGIGAQNHFAATGHGLPVVAVQVCHIGGHINSAVLHCGRQCKLVVVLINGTAYSTQRIVAVCQHVGHGELRHAGGPGGLDDPHIGNVMAGHGVVFQVQILHIAAHIVCLQNAVCHGFLGIPGGVPLLSGFVQQFFGILHQIRSIYQVNSGVI